MKNYVSLIFDHNKPFTEKVAVVDTDGKRKISWKELYEKTCAIANYASSLNLKGVVSVCMPRAIETVEVLLGLGLAGLGVAPLSDHTPQARIEMIEEQTGNHCWTMADYKEAIKHSYMNFRPVAFEKDAPAYVVYTSGSTGTPKGVMLPNDTVVKSYRRMASSEFLSLQPGDVVLQNASFSFVALMIDLFAPLYSGIPTHILPEEARTDINLMTEYINKHHITSMFITPKPLQRLGDTPSLRVVCVGGERVSQLGPKNYRLLNVWGMSETAALALGYQIKAPMEKTPIGKSRGDFRCYIVDEDGNLADEGELCLAGATASGYFKREDLTAATFAPNPYCDEEGYRTLMHTGDIVRRLEDGNIMYLNRKDFMIKINGQRVEPGEAEAVLERMDNIQSAAVKGFIEKDGHSYLCAYYVPKTEIDEENLRKELKKFLPEYMIPAFYVKMDALPLNANGKIDRKALQAPEVSALTSVYVAPENETEKMLCDAFAAILRLERVGANDDFFHLGGDSIRAMSVVNCAGIASLTTAQILSGRTPREIAKLCDVAKEDIFATLSKTNSKAPLTDSQMGIYMECSAAPESLKYNIPFSVRFARKEDMTPAFVKAAIDRVIELHPALYARMSSEGETVYMERCEMPQDGIAVAEEAASEPTEGDWKAFVRPFDFTKSPLCRIKAVLTKEKVVLMADTHHIVSDGSSVAILVKQICASLAGKELEPETVDSFSLYDAQEKNAKALGAEGKAHFEKLLSGVEVDSNLLFDHKSELSENPSKIISFQLKGLDFTRLHREHITEGSFFMGVFAYTLQKMTGLRDCLFGVAESGRKNAALSKTVSMMVKTLPVYTTIDETKNAFDFLADLQKQFYRSMELDVVSFADLSREYGVNSDVMFVYQSDMLSNMETEVGHTEINIRGTGDAIANFATSVYKSEDVYRAYFEYRTDLYDEVTIQRFAELFRTAAVAFSENRPLQTMTLLGENDRAFLDDLNQTQSDYDATETFLDIFERQVKARPEKTALIYEDHSYTYREVDEISDRIAGHIHSLGIGKGQVVSVLIPRSEYMLLASLGIMKAGAMYQPLDPSYPADRLSFMRKDAESQLLIADRDLISILTDFEGKVLFTDEISALPSAEITWDSPKTEEGYILLYTSGTTGLPKGCMLVHRNLTALAHSYSELTEMDENTVVAAYASYGFDAHMADMYPVLSVGGTLTIIPDAIRLDLQAVKDYYESHKVTHAILTTQLCVQFVLAYRSVKYLKVMLSGGEKMVSLEPPISYRLFNAYGPTECTVMETSFVVDRMYDDIPIGKAIANTKLYVVDSANRRVPVGVPGELVIAGPQVAKCYINRPEQTQKAFVPNTFEENVEKGYENCYRTGDIVRFVSDGQMMFIGRRDMQVKIRGFRIELSEVERVIMDFEGVKTATVVAVDAPSGGKVLNAYIVGDQPIDIEQMNAYIRSVKPPYMVPAATMQIDALPLTVNGKVDKRKLPKMEVHFDDMTKPETEMQKSIFEKAAQAVGSGEFGIHTDLFEAGLSSIGSIRLCSLLSEEYGIHVQIRNIKKYPTVAKLEEFVKKSLAPEGSAQERTATAVQSTKEVRYGADHPISKTMEGIFAECVSKPDSTFYNIPYLLKLSSEIDPEKLKDALAAAVEAHSAMKAELFTDKEGRVRQHEKLDDPFTKEMISTIEAKNLDEVKNTLVKPFKITEGRLFEIALIHAGDWYLFTNFHHIIADGTSMNCFIGDVEKAYLGETLTKETYSGFDVAEDEATARTEEDLADAKEYYGALLEGLDRSFLPIPDRYPDQEPASGKILSELSNVALQNISAFCEKNRVSMNAFFVSAFGYVLSRYQDGEYSVFNTIYNGRNDSRTKDTFAMLVKTLPVVCHVDKENACALVKEMSSQLIDSMANDLYSYGEIARAFDVNNDVMFIFQGDSFSRDTFCQKDAEEISLDLSDAKTPMALQVMIKNGQIVCDLEYDPNRFTEKLMTTFLSAFDMACKALAENQKLSEISLISEETQKVLDDFNATEKEYDRSRTITDLFLEQAAATPKKLCAAYKSIRYTYDDVEKLSGKVARLLMEKGIGTGSVVSILINRDENMVITAHGAIRTGAAYLGLDPTYPSDRLEFMIQDSGAAYLIADRTLMDKIPGYSGPVLYTDEIASLPELTKEMEAEFRRNEKYRITPENDTLIIYSSGTTGVPKGSVLQHKAIVCFFRNYKDDVEMDEKSHIATYASFGFDGGAMDVLCVPMCGASLYVIPDEIRMDLASLEQFFVRNEITNSFMTTQVGTMFVSSTKCKTLRYFLVGGEKFIPVMAPEWVCLKNGYGPSETMCYVNRYVVKNTGSLQPIGAPHHNIKEYIIDKHGNRQPFGAAGELCISGGQMGRGYLNRPEKTASVFVENPFTQQPGYERMYRTGDVVRLLTDGNYDFVGRRDGQVKIRGFRVELSEVESQIRKYKGVEKAVVTAFDNPAGGKYLAAYLVAEQELDIDDLKTFIVSEKPDYMVPAVIMQINEIPLTSNGKVDMRKLPKADLRASKKGAEPESETEEQICNIFAEVIGIPKVYADDDFFSIGGSSISAIQVIVKCEQKGMAIVYKDLFANPTAQKLCAFLYGDKEKDILAADLESGDGHDYSALKFNVQANLPLIKNNGVGDVLLTGVTGFLGSHVFRELLESTASHVYCMVRSKAGMTAEERLQMMVVYYFEEWYGENYAERVTVIDADMEQDGILEKMEGYKFDTIINCAANVKHFAAGDSLMGANFTGVENLISLAKAKNAKLIQMSSLSVCGESVNGSVPAGYVFKETDLNIGQSLENKYIYSKYLAEQALIDAVSKKEVRGKVIRLGNLQARFEDSEFQVNAGTNGFLRLFIGFSALGCFPISLMDEEIEFSPIDSVAKAVVLLAGTPDEFTMFHAKNCNKFHYGYFLEALRKLGTPIEIVEDAVFEQRLQEALKNPENVESLGGLLAYRSTVDSTMEDTLKFLGEEDEGKEIRVKIGSETTFTTKALYRLGFAWPLISSGYLDKMVETLSELNYFTER